MRWWAIDCLNAIDSHKSIKFQLAKHLFSQGGLGVFACNERNFHLQKKKKVDFFFTPLFLKQIKLSRFSECHKRIKFKCSGCMSVQTKKPIQPPLEETTTAECSSNINRSQEPVDWSSLYAVSSIDHPLKLVARIDQPLTKTMWTPVSTWGHYADTPTLIDLRSPELWPPCV